MPNGRGGAGDVAERVKILEKAVSSLADGLKRRSTDTDEEIADILRELKGIKLFLSRSAPDFKKQFPEIQRKLK